MPNRTFIILQSIFVRDRIEFGGGSNFSSRVSCSDIGGDYFSTSASAGSSQTSILGPQSESFSYRSQISLKILVDWHLNLVVNGQTYNTWDCMAVRQRFEVAFRPSQFSSLLLFRSVARCFFASRLSVDLCLEQTLESSQWHVPGVERSRNSFTGGCVCMCWTYFSRIKLPSDVCIPADRLYRQNCFPRLASELDLIRLIWSVQINQF
jgi:hypothetical protein